MDEVRDVEWSLLDAAIALRDAWIAVNPTTISNCFKKAGIIKTDIDTGNPDTEPTALEVEEDDEEDLIPLSTLVTRLRAQGNNITMGDLEVILETAPTCHIPTETEVLTSTEPTSTDTLDSGSEENGNDDDDDIEVRPITPKKFSVRSIQFADSTHMPISERHTLRRLTPS